ncbi:MAG: PQQ-binding-like beta-propeller repeat protein [Bryobacteraceae bacterium]
MSRVFLMAALAVGTSFAQQAVQNYKPVTKEELANPSPNDWLSFSRTYDDQRFSPLNQINTKNVGQLRMAWTRGMPVGTVESTPIVRGGVMYIMTSTGGVQALNATNGDLIWEYVRKFERGGTNQRTKAFSIYEDLIMYTAGDNKLVAIDARTGELRWEAATPGRGNSSGSIMAGDKIISSGTCNGTSDSCYIAAHDAKTGKELWKFFTAARSFEPGGDTWGTVPDAKRTASTWGSPGSYDPVKNIVYYGVANPTPNSRLARHNGNPDDIGLSAPADLYSNSTLALDANTGKLLWYYQHLPGDDWDEDWTNERTLIKTKMNPNPKFLKWINPKIKPGEQRDVVFAAGEPGGIFALDRMTGEFLWATPFPYDTPNFWLKDIDVNTGRTTLNKDLIFRTKGEEKTICFFNTRSYWPTAYSPLTNSMYVPYIDVCLDNVEGGKRESVPRPGADPQKLNGIAKINMETGEILHFAEQRAPSNGAVLATAGNLIFWGDADRRFHAYDAVTGKQLWEQLVGGSVSVSTISYAVNGKQYIAILTGEGVMTNGLVSLRAPELKRALNHTAVYVFALP